MGACVHVPARHESCVHALKSSQPPGQSSSAISSAGTIGCSSAFLTMSVNASVFSCVS